MRARRSSEKPASDGFAEGKLCANAAAGIQIITPIATAARFACFTFASAEEDIRVRLPRISRDILLQHQLHDHGGFAVAVISWCDADGFEAKATINFDHARSE